MVTLVCAKPPECPNVPVPLPPSPPAPAPIGGDIVVENSDTIILSGSGTTDDPLRAELAFPLRIDLASTTYDELLSGELQMVYTAVETFSFVNAECEGSVNPAIVTTLTVSVNDAPIGDISIASNQFSFDLNEVAVITPGDVVKITTTEALIFDYLAITLVGNVTP